MSVPKHINILGVPVHDVTYEEALAAVAGFVEYGGSHLVVTVNPEFIMTAQQDEAFKRILNEASLSLPDGTGVLWASRLLGVPLRERVAGVDMVERLAALSAVEGYRLFFLGAAPGVADEAADQLRSRYPGVQIVGIYEGSPALEEEAQIIESVRQVQPDILFVAYGAPRQEKWIHRNLADLNVAVAVGVGGSFDFISGRVMRAPVWMQRMGLEWLHRLWREPWRWRRMLALPRFMVKVWLDRVSSRSGR